MAIRLLRLKSGEDIVADIDENSEYITLESPAQVVPMGDAKGGHMQMGFGPWVPFNKKKSVEIPRDWVVFIVEPADDIVDNYRQAFGSGIMVPPKRITTKQHLTE